MGNIRKRCRRMNMVEILYTHVYIVSRPIETILRMGGRERKENDGGGEFN
jgi:hypothetical protein